MRQMFAALLVALASLQLPAQTRPPAVHPHPRIPSLAQRQLTPREQALQLLNRFTFGPRPGDVDHLLTIGISAWLDQQLNPDAIPDTALNQRLADYPTLTLQPAEALALYPDRGVLQQTADGKRPYPADPQLAAAYQVLVAKYQRDLDEKKTLPNGQLAHPDLTLTDVQKAAQKTLDQATAARIAGDLFALPRSQRMADLLKLPIPDRIAFTTYVAGDQKSLLLSQFNPRERQLFTLMSSGPGGSSGNILRELAEAKLLRSILSERQLLEVMTDFWFNHFNIYAPKDSDQWYTTSFERDAIRKHALGHFHDLLLATAQSPAMLVYLDNWLSIGPDSVANGVNPSNPKSKRGTKGLNENYGRELMELHTLGVNGGYTQADVTALSAILTGWTVDKPNQGGPFLFDPKRHQPGPKQWLGHTLSTPAPSTQPVDQAQQEGLEALNLLAASPKTAHFISYLLAQRFVADDPPPALVDHLTATYLATDGDIKAILRTLIASPEFNSRLYFRIKVKTPLEFVASTFRATATDPANPGALVATLRQMGMPPYNALPPTGYYLTADHWMNSSALVDRLNFAYALTSGKYSNQKFDAPRLLALGLMAQPASAPTGQGTTTPAIYHPSGIGSAASTIPIGPDLALHTLESTLTGSAVAPQTRQLIHKQLAELAPNTPTDTLNLATALILGSPDFQNR